MGGVKKPMNNSTEDWYSTQLTNTNINCHLPKQLTFANTIVSSTSSTFQYTDCIASVIGNGSFGCVFRGIECSTGKPIAIKKMPKVSMKPDELKVMKAVKSNYLVGLIDVCLTDEEGSMHIIMELCDIDLDRHLKQLIDNIVRGYNALYESHIVHRDIKPQNILIKYRKQNLFEVAKISDFGISRILSDDEHKSLSNVAGTLYYMAPEVGANLLRRHEYGHEVDIWSLGCVFYQCIMGKVPFDEQELCRMFLFVAGDNYDAYDKPELSSDIDEHIIRMVNNLLEIDSNKRTTPQQLYSEMCKWGGNRRFSGSSYDSFSYRSNDSIVETDEID
uniref:Protein kinase domain-containing protein n=1 Tax=Setaria digitata TaxID=48799 RepID=A0A915PJC3_9BILA